MREWLVARGKIDAASGSKAVAVFAALNVVLKGFSNIAQLIEHCNTGAHPWQVGCSADVRGEGREGQYFESIYSTALRGSIERGGPVPVVDRSRRTGYPMRPPSAVGERRAVRTAQGLC